LYRATVLGWRTGEAARVSSRSRQGHVGGGHGIFLHSESFARRKRKCSLRKGKGGGRDKSDVGDDRCPVRRSNPLRGGLPRGRGNHQQLQSGESFPLVHRPVPWLQRPGPLQREIQAGCGGVHDAEKRPDVLGQRRKTTFHLLPPPTYAPCRGYHGPRLWC
jgi:hypothetical protein